MVLDPTRHAVLLYADGLPHFGRLVLGARLYYSPDLLLPDVGIFRSTSTDRGIFDDRSGRQLCP